MRMNRVQFQAGLSMPDSKHKILQAMRPVQTTAAGHPPFACLQPQPPTRHAMDAFAATHLGASTVVVSDGLRCFMAVAQCDIRHERIVLRPHLNGEAACVKLPQFRAVNTFLGHLKIVINGTYHAFDFARYAHRHLAEFQLRFNRRFDMKTILHSLLTSLLAAPPSRERRPRAAEIHR
jgi:hypothetical protein